MIQTGNLRAKRIIITKNPSVSISLRLVCGQDDSWCRYSRPSVVYDVALRAFPSLHLITSLFGSEVSERHVKREGDIMTVRPSFLWFNSRILVLALFPHLFTRSSYRHPHPFAFASGRPAERMT